MRRLQITCDNGYCIYYLDTFNNKVYNDISKANYLGEYEYFKSHFDVKIL